MMYRMGVIGACLTLVGCGALRPADYAAGEDLKQAGVAVIGVKAKFEGVSIYDLLKSPKLKLARVKMSGEQVELAAYVHARVSDRAGLRGYLHDVPSHVAFRFRLQRRRPERGCFRGSMVGLYTPLSTLRRTPRDVQRMTQGRRGSLHLHRKRLSLSTPCRFLPAHNRVTRGLSAQLAH